MILTQSANRIIASGFIGAPLPRIMQGLEGRKSFNKKNQLVFEDTEHNLRTFRQFFPDAVLQAAAEASQADLSVFDVGGSSAATKAVLGPLETITRAKPFKHQVAAYEKLKNLDAYALFAEPGTGKTKTECDIICHQFLSRQITGVLVFAWPKGVHHQWVNEQLPANIWATVPYQAAAWDEKNFPAWSGTKGDDLRILTGNIEMLNSPRAMKALEPFLNAHSGSLKIVVDESQSIKNAAASRSKALMSIRHHSVKRAIMTGTPIAKDLTDEWAQFRFLDERIIGHRYKTTFQSQFCIMGGYEGRSVVSHKNVEQFNSIVEPYIFRVTKSEALDLPAKLYDVVTFELSDEQKRHQRSLKESYLTQVASGEIVSVTHAATLFVRLQQLACGYLVDELGQSHRLEENPRLEALDNLIQKRDGKKIIWCRFTQDVELIKAKYGKRAVTYYGATGTQERKDAVSRFTSPDPSIDLFIANPAAAGAGLNLQGECRTAIYYSNSFNAIERWQSEDRIHRIGTRDNVTYFDIVGRGSIDRRILANLRDKKSFSDLVLDDLRRAIDELI